MALRIVCAVIIARALFLRACCFESLFALVELDRNKQTDRQTEPEQ